MKPYQSFALIEISAFTAGYCVEYATDVVKGVQFSIKNIMCKSLTNLLLKNEKK